MLPKEYRLPKNHISELFESGKRIGNQSFLAIYVPSVQSTSQFTIIIKKKKGTSAVERNRTKRLVREALRQHIPLLTKPINAVILVTPQDKTIGLPLYASAVSMLFNRINALIMEEMVKQQKHL